MLFRGIVLVVVAGLVVGCTREPEESQEIIDNLVQAGFPVDDIMVVDRRVYVGRDAEVTLEASRELLEIGATSKEQYRTTNLVGSSITKICINGSTFTGVFSTALDLAIQNYAEQPLRFTMARAPSTGCNYTIKAVIQPDLEGSLSGFPSGGLPYPTITIGDGLAPYGVDVIEHAITHELGHTLGFRHSDWYDHSISCGEADNENEGYAGVGVIWIPGTPPTATVGGSIMNSCFGSNETGEFTSSDKIALRALYASTCTGQTTPGATAWQQYTSQSLYLDVDTAACGYTTVPRYLTSLGGSAVHYLTTGATSIYSPTATGFRVYVFDTHGPVTPADANARRWYLNWQATPDTVQRPELCTGQTTPGATAWQQYNSQSLYLDVNTAACGYTTAPRYITSLGGSAVHYLTTGATSIYSRTATGFRVLVFDTSGPVTPADANARRWHLNWQATPDTLQQPELCTGGTVPGATAWQQYTSQSLYLDVNTATCGYTAVPRYFTSLGGSSLHWRTTGATSIYQATATGFRIYVFNDSGPITPDDANARRWHLNWQARP